MVQRYVISSVLYPLQDWTCSRRWWGRLSQT